MNDSPISRRPSSSARRRRTRFGLVTLTIVVGAMASSVVPASAQVGPSDFLEPPSITPARKQDGVFMRYVGAFVVIFAVVGANLIPSKRGHQD